MKEFKVGDRVRFIEHPGNDCWCATIGDVGTIKAIDRTGTKTWYAVELDIARRKYGSCDGICEKKRGLWSLAESLEHYENAKDNLGSSVNVLPYYDHDEKEIVKAINQLLDSGYEKDEIIEAVKESLSKAGKKIFVGANVRVINTACMLSYCCKKLEKLAADCGEMKDIVSLHYAFGWEPINDGVEELKEKYKIIAMDDAQALIMEAGVPDNLAKVLVIDKEGLERWED